ncbi:hypothetical protein [Prochlorothrix hollandica]|uniref:hypothetical protein n=1 Tax=Prochlorothrix hollandica TaxID=1223 RepID=UPI00035C14E1|nr:hypothetical protein [Prochlorothrix hollandica]
MADDARTDMDNGEAIAEADLKVAEVAGQIFDTTPQTVNRWVREILTKYNVALGYYEGKTRYLRPSDIDVIRKYREGMLEEEQPPVQGGSRPDGDRVGEAADEAFRSFSNLTTTIDDQISTALDARDAYIEDRSLMLADAMHPDSICAEILIKAGQNMAAKGAEDLGELAIGGMIRQFRRSKPKALPGISPGSQRMLTGEAVK